MGRECRQDGKSCRGVYISALLTSSGKVTDAYDTVYNAITDDADTVCIMRVAPALQIQST